MSQFYIFCVGFLGLCLVPIHDIHISKLEINYAADVQAYQMAVKIFIDDLESAITTEESQQIYLVQDNELANADELIIDYLNETILVKLDGQLRSWQMIGKEPSEDLSAVWCYLEIENVAPHESFDLEVRLLYELFDDQRNIVSVDGFIDQRQHFIFDKSDYTKRLLRE